MLHACVERFDVMSGRGNILGWDGEVNKALAFFLSDCQIASSSSHVLWYIGILFLLERFLDIAHPPVMDLLTFTLLKD
jgi:hypothetical protein